MIKRKIKNFCQIEKTRDPELKYISNLFLVRLTFTRKRNFDPYDFILKILRNNQKPQQRNFLPKEKIFIDDIMLKISKKNIEAINKITNYLNLDLDI